MNHRLYRRLASVAAGALVAFGAQAGVASATPTSDTCTGGSVAPGTYTSLTITGMCLVDSGDVTVQHSLVVAPGGALGAMFGGSDLAVGQNVSVGRGGILVLGCEPEAFTCFNDSQDNPTMSTHDTVGGNLTADGALMMLVHGNEIDGNVTQAGGGGGVTCDLQPLGPDGPPAYSTYEDNHIGGNATITGVHTCWMGFIRNTVANNVTYVGNVLADPDGNEVVTNTIGRNLNCAGNDPTPQVGDSGGNPNTVGGRANGQCA